MKLNRALTLALLCGAAALAGGCNIYSCVYRTRFVATAPEASVAGVGSFAGYVNLRDYSEGQPVPTDIVWNIEMTGATATPTRLLLADRTDTTRVLATMPIQQTQGRISASAVTIAARADRDRVFDILARGNAVLIITMSDRSSPVLISLRVTDLDDWHRPNCS